MTTKPFDKSAIHPVICGAGGWAQVLPGLRGQARLLGPVPSLSAAARSPDGLVYTWAITTEIALEPNVSLRGYCGSAWSILGLNFSLFAPKLHMTKIQQVSAPKQTRGLPAYRVYTSEVGPGRFRRGVLLRVRKPTGVFSGSRKPRASASAQRRSGASCRACIVVVAVMGNASQIENLIKLVNQREHTAAITHHEQPIIGPPPQRRLR